MINLFARKGIDGLIMAACYHKEAKKLGAGIHVTYVGNNADSELLDLMANIELAVSVEAHLPQERRVILFKTSLGSSRRRTMDQFLSLHPDVDFVVEDALPIAFCQRMFTRFAAVILRPFLGRDETVILLAHHIMK